ncbi:MULTISPECIES: TetR/AcrR family transcriptional regulator [Streptomyces]|uniref:TetR/AcrR family transcriptional regulator n=1 Tax=Streptomyces TaxID=1883 RepID=UPI0004C61923|nr:MULTISPECIES: TetR/AcrR family transcriptional regulator [unclassified Streptomyces]SED69762.1 transcriptional regulator, TetR family [Streptomyces sp. PAN_FS17]SEE79656.1 transcriptional regulator, TetR family [Streptomyces sp. KS_5]
MAERTAPGRVDRRRARTRTALVEAAQRLLAEGRTDVPILEITELADIGVGSFYNHFDSKEELFRVAVAEALEWWGSLMDRLTADIDDPAVAFTQSFRMTGRLHRRHPELSRVLLNQGLELARSERGLAPRAFQDIRAAVDAGRFEVEDLDLALTMTAAAVLALGSLLHAQPDRDDAKSADLVALGLLRQFGLPADEAARICALDLPDLDAVDTLVG